MTYVKCNLCQTLNGIEDEICKGCGAQLDWQFREYVSSPPPANDAQSAPRPALAGIPRFDGAGDVIGPTISLFFKNLWLITKIVFVIVAPLEIFKALSAWSMEHDWQLTVGIVSLQLLSNALIVPALFYALMKVMETGSAPSVNEAYRWGLSKIPKLCLSAVLSWILIGLGTLLCIIPGVMLSLAFTVVYPVAVFEKGSPVDVLKRSYELTESRLLNILLAGFVVGILVAVCTAPASLAVAALTVNQVNFVPLQVAAAIYGDIIAEASTVFSLVVYLSILRTLGRGHSILE